MLKCFDPGFLCVLVSGTERSHETLVSSQISPEMLFHTVFNTSASLGRRMKLLVLTDFFLWWLWWGVGIFFFFLSFWVAETFLEAQQQRMNNISDTYVTLIIKASHGPTERERERSYCSCTSSSISSSSCSPDERLLHFLLTPLLCCPSIPLLTLRDILAASRRSWLA